MDNQKQAPVQSNPYTEGKASTVKLVWETPTLEMLTLEETESSPCSGNVEDQDCHIVSG